MLTLLASAPLIDGHNLLSDWLLIVAAALFSVAAIVIAATSERPWVDWSGLVAAGLAATAIALLVV